jgi:hypothetical protein
MWESSHEGTDLTFGQCPQIASECVTSPSYDYNDPDLASKYISIGMIVAMGILTASTFESAIASGMKTVAG